MTCTKRVTPRALKAGDVVHNNACDTFIILGAKRLANSMTWVIVYFDPRAITLDKPSHGPIQSETISQSVMRTIHRALKGT